MELKIRKVEAQEALQIASWVYPPPYQKYNLHGSPLAIARLLRGRYFAVFAHNQLRGFFCYGSSAQLTNKKEHELYQGGNYLDFGLGMHPDYCNQGLGLQFAHSGLLFAVEQGWSGGFRLTVAFNNLRAMKIYLRLGFQEVGRIVWDSSPKFEFLVMTLDGLGQGAIGTPFD